MATRKCKDCGNQVSTRAKQCPNCGAPAPKKAGCLGVIAFLFLVSVFIGIISSIGNNEPASPKKQPVVIKTDDSDQESPDEPKPDSGNRANVDPEKEPEVVSHPVNPAPEPEVVAAPKPEPPDWPARQAELKKQFLSEFSGPQVGSSIVLTLKSGTKQQGVIQSLTEEEIQIARGAATIGFSPQQLSTSSRVRCFAADFATYKAYKETKQEREAFEERERAARAAIEAERQAEQAAEMAAQRKKRIEAGFSSWDGSHIKLTRIIKESMNDPKSYKHDETGWWDRGDHLIVRTSFRGKNAFGGVVLNWVKAKCDLDGNVIAVIEQGP